MTGPRLDDDAHHLLPRDTVTLDDRLHELEHVRSAVIAAQILRARIAERVAPVAGTEELPLLARDARLSPRVVAVQPGLAQEEIELAAARERGRGEHRGFQLVEQVLAENLGDVNRGGLEKDVLWGTDL